MKAYLIRHQKHGFVTSHVFLEPPTKAQVAPILADIATRHATGWVRIVEVDLMGPGEVPQLPPPPEAPAGMAPMTIKGVGHVG